MIKINDHKSGFELWSRRHQNMSLALYHEIIALHTENVLSMEIIRKIKNVNF